MRKISRSRVERVQMCFANVLQAKLFITNHNTTFLRLQDTRKFTEQHSFSGRVTLEEADTRGGEIQAWFFNVLGPEIRGGSKPRNDEISR